MNGELNLDLITKVCSICKRKRRFVKGSPRDLQSICGSCWDWESNPIRYDGKPF